MNNFLASIQLARSEFPTMRFADFCNLWQITDEIKTLGTMSIASANLEQRNQRNILKIIKKIPDNCSTVIILMKLIFIREDV